MVGMRANKCRGQTKQQELLLFFGRVLWVGMQALVDVLDYFPRTIPSKIVELPEPACRIFE
jgi:hypothetical protein